MEDGKNKDRKMQDMNDKKVLPCENLEGILLQAEGIASAKALR